MFRHSAAEAGMRSGVNYVSPVDLLAQQFKFIACVTLYCQCAVYGGTNTEAVPVF